MPEWPAYALGFAGISAALLLARRTDARAARMKADRAAPDGPCWTEQIASDGRHSYGRSHCVNEALMEAGARARSSDFPIPAGAETRVRFIRQLKSDEILHCNRCGGGPVGPALASPAPPPPRLRARRPS